MVQLEEALALLGEGQMWGEELGIVGFLCWDHVGLCTAKMGDQDGLLGHQSQAAGAEAGEWCWDICLGQLRVVPKPSWSH